MPALIATITGNAQPLKVVLQRSLKDVEEAARRGADLTKKAAHVNSGAMREFLVLLREISRGNWSRVPGSVSILAQRLNLLKYLLSPITLGLIAVGTAALFTFRHFLKLEEESMNLRKAFDITERKFTEQAEALRKAGEAAQATEDYIRKLESAQEGLAEKTEEALKAMREQYHLEREIAEGRGASKKKLEQMDLDEAKRELEVVTKAHEQAVAKAKADEALLKTVSAAANDPDRAGASKTVGEKRSLLGKVVDAMEEKARKPSTGFSIGQGLLASGSPLGALLGGAKMGLGAAHQTDPNSIFEVEVEGKMFKMSMKEAKEKFMAISREEEKLNKIQKELTDLYEAKKDLTAKDVADRRRLEKEQREIQAHIDNLTKFGPALAQLGGKSSSMHLTSLQGAGGFGATSVGILDVNHKMLRELKNISAKVGTPKMGGVKH